MGKGLTRAKIENVNKLYDELDIVADALDIEIKNAKQTQGNLILIKRKQGGKEIEISEKLAWEEIRLLGAQSECYNALKGRYPAVFEKMDAHLAKIKEIDTYTQAEIGIRFNAMTVRDVINLVVAVVDMKE
ncbi:MAG: hypothetical protein WC499_02530 [Patescibacteria group bacterium]